MAAINGTSLSKTGVQNFPQKCLFKYLTETSGNFNELLMITIELLP